MIGKNLKKYRLLNRWSLREMANRLGVSHQTIKKYEDGFIVPDQEKIKRFAKLFKVEVKDLINSFDVPALNFDSLDVRNLKKNQIESLKIDIEESIAKYIEVLYLANDQSFFYQDEWSFDVKNKKALDSIAIKVREKIGVNNCNPLGNLIDKLEDNNFLILEIDNDNFTGFSEIIDNKAFIVLSNKFSFKNRFYLARELGKIILKLPKELSAQEQNEYYDYFVYSLFLPALSIEREVKNYLKCPNIYFNMMSFITKKYDITNEIFINRLLSLNIINVEQFDKLVSKIKKQKRKIYVMSREKPNKKVRLIFILEIEKIISTSEAVRLLGITKGEYYKLYN